MPHTYIYQGEIIHKISIYKTNKRLKRVKIILHQHHTLNFFPTQFCFYVQFIQIYNHDNNQSDI